MTATRLSTFMMGLLAVLGAALAIPAAAEPRVVSLDECADQYVLGLVPADHILALSNKATLPDAFYRDRVGRLQRVPPKIETVLALHPDAVVRTWGGDVRLLQMLARFGIKIITINDISAYDKARGELLRVGHELGQDAAAQGEAAHFQAALDDIRPIGLGRSVLYYTPSGYSAGPDTMVGDILRRLDFRLESQDKSFYYLSPEVLLSMRPDVFALAFYDDRFAMRRVPGRNPEVRRLIAATPHFTLPQQSLACSGWFTAYAVRDLSLQTHLRP